MSSMSGLRVLAGVLASVCLGHVGAAALPVPRSVVFYYGEKPLLNELSRFQIAVLEPDSGFRPLDAASTDTYWFAYVSVGEVTPDRSYYGQVPRDWIIGRNQEWDSDIIDQTVPQWPEFFVQHIIAPLWDQGYRGFFLDTLDTYQLVADNDFDRRRNQHGLIAVIRAIRARYPEAALILNRGFELLPAIHDDVYALAFESLFRGWSESEGQYTLVAEDDREWLLNEIRHARESYGLPVIAIDYCRPTDVQCTLDTAWKIRRLGMIPYVGDGRLQTVNLSVLP